MPSCPKGSLADLQKSMGRPRVQASSRPQNNVRSLLGCCLISIAHAVLLNVGIVTGKFIIAQFMVFFVNLKKKLKQLVGFIVIRLSLTQH